MGNITLNTKPLSSKIKAMTRRYTTALKRNIELELLAEVRAASRANYRNRTGRLWRSQRRIAGVGARIGSRNTPYWKYLDNFTRGSGRFVRQLLDSSAVRQRIISRAIARTHREL